MYKAGRENNPVPFFGKMDDAGIFQLQYIDLFAILQEEEGKIGKKGDNP